MVVLLVELLSLVSGEEFILNSGVNPIFKW